MKNQLTSQKTVHLLHPYVAKSDGVKESAVLDCFGYDAVSIFCHVGETAEALAEDLSLTLKLVCSHRPDGGWMDVPSEEIVLESPDDAKDIWHLNYVGSARYVKLCLAFEGEHARGTMLSIVAVLTLPHIAPIH